MLNTPYNIKANWNKICYISKRLEPTIDDEGNEIDNNYDKPKKYCFNYQPVRQGEEAELRAYGVTETGTIKAYLDYAFYIDKINEFDLAYLYGANPNNERYNGEKANYRVVTAIPQNQKILVYFTKLVKTKGGYQNAESKSN